MGWLLTDRSVKTGKKIAKKSWKRVVTKVGFLPGNPLTVWTWLMLTLCSSPRLSGPTSPDGQ